MNGTAAGTSVNVPLEPGTGEGAWLGAVRTLLPELAAAFGPDVIVSQHGADSHAWDPLAHLLVTTTAMGEAARLVDRVAHRYAGGRWLATGGGGYDAYRVVPRSWSLVWLAGAHREVPDATPVAWRERWAAEGARYGQAPLPLTFDDAPNAGLEKDPSQTAAETRSLETAALVRRLVVPRLLQVARDRGWWDPVADAVGGGGGGGGRAGRDGWSCHDSCRSRATGAGGIRSTRSAETVAVPPTASGAGEPTVVGAIDVVHVGSGDARVACHPAGGPRRRTCPGPRGHPRRSDRLGRARREPGRRSGDRRTGLTSEAGARCSQSASLPRTGSVVSPGRSSPRSDRVAPTGLHAEITLAERDPIEPLERAVRAAIARRLLEGAGFAITPASSDVRAADPAAFRAVRPSGRDESSAPGPGGTGGEG